MAGKLALKKAKGESKGKSDAIKALTQDTFLSGPTKALRIDMDSRLVKGINELRSNLTTLENKTVSQRMLITEALRDLMEKYKKGEGKYHFEDDDHSWTFNTDA